MIKPQRLESGDTIGIIAPASPVDKHRLSRSFDFFESLGLDTKIGRHIDHIQGYLAGTDEERLADFHQMVADTQVKAIFFARGGYGTGRIVDNIDYNLVRQNPKIMWGYSDITYLHTAIRQATGLITFHGPMPASDITDEDFDPLSAQLFQQLFQPTKLNYNDDISPLQIINSGEAAGELIGGNLSLLVSTLGTKYELDANGKILLLEDIGEEPYRVDAMLNQLKLAGKLHDAAGIIVGDFANAEPKKEKPSLTLEQVFHDYFAGLPCPVLAGFKIGHCFPHFSVPLGASAEMSTIKKSLIMDAGIR